MQKLKVIFSEQYVAVRVDDLINEVKQEGRDLLRRALFTDSPNGAIGQVLKAYTPNLKEPRLTWFENKKMPIYYWDDS